jgi:hypothetical protein
MPAFKSGEAACLHVQVSSTSQGALHRHCPCCKTRRRFVHSGKFRVNAQKKRIDAWLIFRCTACDERWNWPVHERRPVAAIDPIELDALMRNDPDLAARHAQAAVRQSRPGSAQQEVPVRSVALAVLEPATPNCRSIEIILAITGPSLRLDRILAQALTLGRAEIDRLDRLAAISVVPAARRVLRRPASDGQRILIDLTVCTVEMAMWLRRRLEAQPPDL